LKRTFTIFYLLLISVTVANGTETEIDSSSIKNNSSILPVRHPKGTYLHSIGIQYVVPPKDWTLDIVKAPMFNYSGKYSLPGGFDIEGGLSTIIVSNRFYAGPYWNWDNDNFHIGVGVQVAYNLGYLSEFGFKTVLTGLEEQPSITLGYNFNRTAIILRGDLYYTSDLSVSEGGHTVDFNEHFINGYSFLLAYEQPLHNKTLMYLGLKMGYLRYHIIAWPALPVNSYHYWVPEFHVGINL
jgi:hypothetical protein